MDFANAAKILGFFKVQMFMLMRDGLLPYIHVVLQRRLI
jgi:hypothetical protein